mgnify:CR=1 FL=1
MEPIITAVGEVLELSGTILTTITSNPILTFIFASSFVGIGVNVFGKLRKVCK